MRVRADIDRIGYIWTRPNLPEGWKPGDAKPVRKKKAGYHVNVTPEVLAARSDLLPFVSAETVLPHVWAGDDPAAPVLTVSLVFASEAKAEEYLPTGAPSFAPGLTADTIPAESE